MAIKVTVQDSIISDLFDVSFNDNLLNGLLKYIEREPTYVWENGEMVQRGTRFVMKHTDLIKVMQEMAL